MSPQPGTILSPDGYWKWNGTEWVPANSDSETTVLDGSIPSTQQSEETGSGDSLDESAQGVSIQDHVEEGGFVCEHCNQKFLFTFHCDKCMKGLDEVITCLCGSKYPINRTHCLDCWTENPQTQRYIHFLAHSYLCYNCRTLNSNSATVCNGCGGAIHLPRTIKERIQEFFITPATYVLGVHLGFYVAYILHKIQGGTEFSEVALDLFSLKPWGWLGFS